MGGQDDARAQLGVDAQHQVQHPAPAVGIEPVGGLVQENQFRAVHQGLGQLHALSHACGIAADGAVAGLVQPHKVEHLVGAVPGGFRREAAQFAPESHLVVGGGILDKGVVFGHVADAGPQPGGLGSAQGHAQHRAGSAGRGQEAQQGLQQGGLAGAVGPQQAHDAAVQGQGQALQGGHRGRGIAHFQVLEGDQRGLQVAFKSAPG